MRFGFWFFLIKLINLQESSTAPPNPIFTSFLHCKWMTGTIKISTFLRNFGMNSPASSRSGIWRWQLCDKRGCEDIAVPPCLTPAAPALHPLVTDTWIILTGSQFWCFHLKQAHFFCCQDLFRVQLSQSAGLGLELVQVGAQDSCSRIYLF